MARKIERHFWRDTSITLMLMMIAAIAHVHRTGATAAAAAAAEATGVPAGSTGPASAEDMPTRIVGSAGPEISALTTTTGLSGESRSSVPSGIFPYSSGLPRPKSAYIRLYSDAAGSMLEFGNRNAAHGPGNSLVPLDAPELADQIDSGSIGLERELSTEFGGGRPRFALPPREYRRANNFAAGEEAKVLTPEIGSTALSGSAFSATRHRIVTRATRQHYCGEILVNALALVCGGNYAKRAEIGRNTAGALSGRAGGAMDAIIAAGLADEAGSAEQNELSNEFAASPQQSPPIFDMFSLLKAARPIPIAASHQQQQQQQQHHNHHHQYDHMYHLPSKRGVVDECCKKPCSTTTLTQYCGANA